MPDSMPDPHIRTLRIQDYQSIVDLTIELGRVTVLVGDNDKGKSTVMRALHDAMFNRAGDSFIRIQSKSQMAVVTITFSSGDVVVWRKKKGKGGEYEVNGEVMTRVGKDLPPQLTDITGMRRITVGDFKATLNFMRQGEDAFLLENTGGQTARFLAYVARLMRLVNAQSLAKKDATRARREAEAAVDVERGLREQLDGQPNYAALAERAAALVGRETMVSRRETVLATNRVKVSEVKVMSTAIAEWGARDVTNRVRSLQGRALAVEGLADLWTEKHDQLAAYLAACEGLTAAERRLAVARKLSTLYERVAPMAARVEALAVKRKAIGVFRKAAEDEAIASGQVGTTRQRADMAKEEYDRLMARFTICPVCERPMETAT